MNALTVRFAAAIAVADLHRTPADTTDTDAPVADDGRFGRAVDGGEACL
jgi:hypothetical protein